MIGAVGAFYTWLLTRSPIEPGLWMLPAGLAWFGGLRSLSLFLRMGVIAEYMKKIEMKWAPGERRWLPGWERHFAAPGNNNKLPLSVVTIAFWVAIIGITHAAPFAYAAAHRNDPPKPEKPLKVQIVGAG